MTKPDALIFDIDGTLWNTVETCVRSWQKAIAIKTLPYQITEDVIRSIMGLNHEALKNELFNKYNFIFDDDLLALCYQFEYDYIDHFGGYLYHSVYEEMHNLACHYRLFLVSNCQSLYMQLFLKKSNLLEIISDVECFGNTGLKKSQNIRLISERNSLINPVYIGDTVSDQIAAEEAGFPFYWAEYGFGNVKHYQKAFKDFKELSVFFLKMTAM